LSTPTSPADNQHFDHIIDALAEQGYIILDNLIPDPVLQQLSQHFDSIDQADFKHAGVGRSDSFQTNQQIRSDRIHWLNHNDASTQPYFQQMELLRQQVNRHLFLGLFDYECHYAHYPAGSFYQRHVDAFKGQGNRRLTTILYLNKDWQNEDGGQLKMYHDDENVAFAEVKPEYGRMVIFLSEQFPHEVCVSNRSRRSITGWFRINNSNSQTVDPMA
jgi:SM-20-related protein